MKREVLLYLILAVVALLLFVADLLVGSVDIPFDLLLSKEGIYSSIFFDIRLPKAITSVLVGVALGVSGLLMQTLFRNPLAGPSILGISSGATLGVALYVLFFSVSGLSIVSLSIFGSVLCAMLGAFIMLLIILLVSFVVKDSVTLLIVGVITGSLTSSVVSVLQNLSEPESVKHFVNWTLGNVEVVSWSQLQLFIPIVFFVILLLLGCIKSLDAFLLGESYAQGVGVSVRKHKLIVITLTAVLTGVTTAFTGPIGFIGIIVPHVARMLFNTSKHAKIYPASILIGMITMLLCDILSQLPSNGYILPINAVTALIGAPIVLWILLGRNKMVV